MMRLWRIKQAIVRFFRPVDDHTRAWEALCTVKMNLRYHNRMAELHRELACQYQQHVAPLQAMVNSELDTCWLGHSLENIKETQEFEAEREGPLNRQRAALLSKCQDDVVAEMYK